MGSLAPSIEIGGVVARVVEEVARPHAERNDREGRFPHEGVAELGRVGLLGLPVPKEFGGLGLGPREFSQVVASLAEGDPSLAMVYVMHICATLCVARSPPNPRLRAVLQEIARGEHLATLAFSETGSRSHFWSPVSRAERREGGVRISAEKSFVTSAGNARSMVVTTQTPAAGSPMETTLYLVDSRSPGVRVQGAFNGLGLRGNDSSPVSLDRVEVPEALRLTEEGKGMEAKLQLVLPWFNLGLAAMDVGFCRATVGDTVDDWKRSRLEHLGTTLGETYPTLRERLARMQVETDGLAARVERLVGLLEQPGPETMLAVLETKAAANEVALGVTEKAMRICGGAAFSRRTPVERFFRDAQGGAVMCPTVDQLHDFIGRSLLGLALF